jgi:tetratricopeptide (TPR) repeat protein
MKRIIGLSLALTLTLAVFGQSAKKFYKTGEEFYNAGNFQDAITQFTNAISLNGEYEDAYYMRGLSYEKAAQYQKAIDDFKRAEIFDPKNEVIYSCLGRNLYNLGQYQEAMPLLIKALRINRKLVEAYQTKILVMLKLDKAYDALKTSDSLLALDGSAYDYFLAGKVNEALNSNQKAEWDYLKSVKEDRKFVDGYIALSNLQLKMSKLDDAMNNVNEVFKIEPNSRIALITRSQIFLKKIDYRNAIDDISRGIVLNPDDIELYFIRGQYYQDFSQHQNAINDFNKVILLDPKNADALFQRARSFEEIGNFSSAIKDYRSLVSISEFDGKALKLLKQAQDRLFELNRENDPPQIVLADPAPKDKFTIEVPLNKNKLKVKGTLKDKSDISFLKINGKDIKLEKLNDQTDFYTEVELDSTGVISISASDVYNNVEKATYKIARTEVTPPKVGIVAPIASDNGIVYLDNNDPSIYVEGKVSDESLIKSILIDGMSASFKLDEKDPTFSANINITNKDKFTVVATDIYGNQDTTVFKLNRDGAALLANNPMGKTWVVFIENSKYTSFASLEGPVKDVKLMNIALAKYQVSQYIYKKDMTKEQMEKFFSIELRDLIKGNRVNSLLVWYAGHGKFINETGYWIPVDANRDDEFTYFNINFLRAAMQSYSSLSHTLVITDACESGPSFYTSMRGAPTEPNCSDWQKTRLKSSQVFSSAGYELAADKSQFTQTFAAILASNPNACIPIESIVNKVTSTVSQNAQQKPKFGKITGLTDEDGTFFFIAK